MRVVEPHQFQNLKKRKQKRQFFRLAFLVPLLILLSVFGYVTFAQKHLHKPSEEVHVSESSDESSQQNEVQNTAELTLKKFTDEEFKQLYTSFAYPNTQQLTQYPTITGNHIADERLYTLAEERGYKLSAVPVANIIKINEPYLTEDDLLQQNAKIGWDGLSRAAAAAGIPLQITSAYRSIEFQRGVFLQRMRDAGISASGIADGYSDLAVSRVMDEVAPPGFSRHHNGYTIDLACDGVGLHGFKHTVCYEWISDNNFEIAKQHGWIPSYPEEAKQQGPEPEPWEFIWVGTINLYE